MIVVVYCQDLHLSVAATLVRFLGSYSTDCPTVSCIGGDKVGGGILKTPRERTHMIVAPVSIGTAKTKDLNTTKRNFGQGKGSHYC